MISALGLIAQTFRGLWCFQTLFLRLQGPKLIGAQVSALELSGLNRRAWGLSADTPSP